MRKFTLLALSLIISTSSFATAKDECRMIAKSCIKAGYTMKKESAGKEFWHNCMKPILMGEKVEGITIPADDVTACRTAKVNEMQQELKDLQSVDSKSS